MKAIRPIFLLSLAALLAQGCASSETEINHPEQVPRISVKETHDKVKSGEALLVCAYDDEEKCQRLKLEGSISLVAFKKKLSGLPKDKLIVFY